ncbi:MAG: DNA repair protein RecO [Clostridia bacterium]|nr:DNA repair protein RecO [Clostridia bacterium]
MDLTTQAITLKATDYKENDKLLQIYSVDLGKLTVHARGIKKATAKLKFAGEPFCFGNFQLVATRDRYTLATCEQIESFYSLREDLVAFYAGCSILETLAVMETEAQPNPQVFVATLKSLSQLTSGVNPKLVALHFVMGYLALCGYKLQPNLCVTCQQRLDGKAYLDLSQGGFVCQNCQTPNAVVVSRPAKALFDLLDGLPVEKLKNVNATGNQVKECLQVLSTYLSYSFAKIKSLSELAKM